LQIGYDRFVPHEAHGRGDGGKLIEFSAPRNALAFAVIMTCCAGTQNGRG
jgi:hypothetical protein